MLNVLLILLDGEWGVLGVKFVGVCIGWVGVRVGVVEWVWLVG